MKIRTRMGSVFAPDPKNEFAVSNGSWTCCPRAPVSQSCRSTIRHLRVLLGDIFSPRWIGFHVEQREYGRLDCVIQGRAIVRCGRVCRGEALLGAEFVKASAVRAEWRKWELDEVLDLDLRERAAF